MAEIEIERRPRRRPWTWLALLLVLAGVAVGVWLVFGDGATQIESAPAAEVGPAPGDGAVQPGQTQPPVQPAPTGTDGR